MVQLSIKYSPCLYCWNDPSKRWHPEDDVVFRGWSSYSTGCEGKEQWLDCGEICVLPTPQGTSWCMIEFSDVTKSYSGKLPVLAGVSFHIDEGEFFYLSGVSGAGKTTIFRLLLLMELPDSGAIVYNGQEINTYSAKERSRHRRNIGMVHQDLDNRLLVNETVEENIALPLRISGGTGRSVMFRVNELLERVGLEGRGKELVKGLSGGEKQLVSIARALVFQPPVFFADEPTGNLDQTVAYRVMELLREIHRDGSTVIVATHDLNLIRTFRARTLLIKDKKIQEVKLAETTHRRTKTH